MWAVGSKGVCIIPKTAGVLSGRGFAYGACGTIILLFEIEISQEVQDGTGGVGTFGGCGAG